MHKPVALVSSTTALLLIDFQEEQRADPYYRVGGFDDVITNAQQLLAAARERGLFIYHAAYKRDYALCPPRPFEPVSAEGRPLFSESSNSLTDICHELAPRQGETVIIKNDASVFSEDGFEPSLKGDGIEWLIIAGVWTDACVAATVRDAMAAGYHVLLVKDSCGSGTRAMHEVAVLNLANRLYGGGVTDTANAVALIGGAKRDIWITERPVPIFFDYANAAEFHGKL